MSNSLVEYRESLASFLARFPWQYFITLTWDPARRPRLLTSRRTERLARVAMCMLARQVAGRKWQELDPTVIQYAGVIESSLGGELHVHLVAIIVRPLEHEEIRAFSTWWLRRFGIAKVVPVTNNIGLASYLAKAAGPSEEFFVSEDLR